MLKPRRPSSGTRILGHMRTSSTSTIIRHMPMEAYRLTGNARCSTATQRPSFRWVLPQGRLESSARRARETSKQHNNVNITLNTRTPSLSLSLLVSLACLLAQLSWSASQRSSGGLHERHRRAPSISQCGSSGATVCGGHLSVQLRYAHLLLARWAPRLPRGLLEHR